MQPNGHKYTQSYNSSSSNGSYAAYHDRMNSLSRSESKSSRTHYEDFTATPSPKVMNEYAARNSLQWDLDQSRSNRQRRVAVDPIGEHLLVETALADSAGFDILSIEELEELKKQEASISRHIPALRKELALETKYRDAARGFSRLDEKDKRNRANSRMSQNEYAASAAKCDQICGELYQYERRLSELREQRLRHTAGVLQIDHDRRNEAEMNKINGFEDSDEWDSGFSLTRFAPGGLADTEDGIMDIPGGHDPHTDATLNDLWTMLNSHDELIGTRDMSDGIVDEPFSLDAFSEKVQILCSHAAGLSHDLESEREARFVTETAQKSNREQLLQQLQAAKDKHEENENAIVEAQQQADEAHQARADLQADHATLETEVVRLQTEVTMVKAELDSVHGTKAQRAAEQSEFKAQNETLQQELQELVAEHEALTQQGIEAERERERLESHIDQLRERMEGLEVRLQEERVRRMGKSETSTPASSQPAPTIRGNEDPTSLRVMRSEFKKMMRDARAEHFKGLKVEQDERRRLEGIIRSLKKDQGNGTPSVLSPSTLSPPPLGRSGLGRNMTPGS